ncbi:MAG: hypothetical protein M3Q80_01335 [bacterium]|nr:hypothetical protein [bacterium]
MKKIQTRDQKIAAGKPLVEDFQRQLENGAAMGGTILSNIPCLGTCSNVLRYALVNEKKSSQAADLWNFSFHCADCNYHSNLAKFIPNYKFGQKNQK